MQRSSKGWGNAVILCGYGLDWNKAGIYFIVFYDQNLFDAFRDRYIRGNEENYTWNRWVFDVYSQIDHPDQSRN